MKKLTSLLLVILNVFLLTSCVNRYKEVNKRLPDVAPEETNYIIFNSDYIIDETTKYKTTDIIKEIFNDNDVSFYGEIYKSSYYFNNELYLFITFQERKKEDHSYALAVLDIPTLNTLHFERFSNFEDGERMFYKDEFNNVLLYLKGIEELHLYKRDNNSINKKVFQLIRRNDYYKARFYKTIFYGYSYYEEIGQVVEYAFDYVKEKEVDVNLVDLNYVRQTEKPYIKDGITYELEFGNTTFKIKTADDEIIYDVNIVDLFKESNAGRKINQIFKDLNKEEDPLLIYVERFNNELYFLYKYRTGLLMNNAFFGSTPLMFFRFDFETKSLKYIGLDIHPRYIYQKNS